MPKIINIGILFMYWILKTDIDTIFKISDYRLLNFEH